MTEGDRRRSVSTWKLERYLLDELPAAEQAQLRQRIEADAELRRRVDELRGDTVALLAAYPAPWMARQIEGRAGARPATVEGRAPWALRWLAPVAAMTLLAVVAVPMLRTPPADEAPTGSRILAAKARDALVDDGVRVKGSVDGARLWIHRRTGQGSERLDDGASARRGDLLRLQYAAEGASHGVILSIDGRGAVTRHLPLAGTTAAPLAADGVVSLETAYELDDAPRWECFFLISADHAFDVDPVLQAAHAAVAGAGVDGAPPAVLELPAGLAQTALTLTKVEPTR